MALRRTLPLVVAAALALGACDLTGPDRGNTRVLASSLSVAGASRAVLPVAPLPDRDDRDRPENPSLALALVKDLEVTITAVQALPAQFLDRETEGSWETLTLSTPARVNLFALPTDSLGGLELFDGDLPPGAYVRMRFLVSEITLTLAAPLRIGRHSFPADEEIEIRVRDPWVRVPGAYFTVSDDSTANVHVYFDPVASFGQLVVTPDGALALAPVINGRGRREKD